MGTRADFYVGRGVDAEWLGSIAWDGHPDSVCARYAEISETGTDAEDSAGMIGPAADAAAFRVEVAKLSTRRDWTAPSVGWPWPWEDSGTTDFAYAFDGSLWVSCFGRAWVSLETYGAKHADDDWWDGLRPKAVFPNMKARANVTLGPRSGLIIVGGE